MPQTVAVLVYPGFELLDAAGPASVFAAANHVLGQRGKPPTYEVLMLSPQGGAVASSSGVQLETMPISRRPPPAHTFLIAGAERESLQAVIADPEVRRWAPLWARVAVRYGSVCAGTFILAALGLAEGRRVASHWSACRPLAAAYPSVSVDADSIYVVDGEVWTSAGVTTGIDMALAMVAHDTDVSVANDVARRLLLYARRPGYQSQFSPVLRAQIAAGNPFTDLVDWMHSNLEEPMDIASLAGRAGLTERTFFRKFMATTGESPARFVEAVRLDAARLLLTEGLSLKQTAARVGLSPPTRLAKAFERRFGVSPQLFRELHGPPGDASMPSRDVSL